MGACLSGPAACGVEDAGAAGAALVTVALTTGLEVPVHVLPGDTMRAVNAKVEAVHGKQPPVVVRKQLVHPELHCRFERKWVAVSWDATLAQLPEASRSKLKYSDVTDILKKVRVGRHAHWAASHVVHGGIDGGFG